MAAPLADVTPDAAWWPRAAVLAGLPGYRAQYDGGREDELNIRTHCPAHRGVLAKALREDLTPAVTIETSAW